METTNGALKFPALQDNPPMLLGHPANELSNMDGTIDAGQNNSILLYGSFDQYVCDPEGRVVGRTDSSSRRR